jgi:hypothetical protein
MEKHHPASQKSLTQWETYCKTLVKAELAKRDVDYPKLAELLRGIGIEETPVNLANKINRGKFSAIFLFQVLEVIGCKLVRLHEE